MALVPRPCATGTCNECASFVSNSLYFNEYVKLEIQGEK